MYVHVVPRALANRAVENEMIVSRLYHFQRGHRFTSLRLIAYQRQIHHLIAQTTHRLSEHNAKLTADFIHDLPSSLAELEKRFFKIRHALNKQQQATQQIHLDEQGQPLPCSNAQLEQIKAAKNSVDIALAKLEATQQELESLRKIERLWYSPKILAVPATPPVVDVVSTVKTMASVAAATPSACMLLASSSPMDNTTNYFMNTNGALPLTIVNPEVSHAPNDLPSLEHLKSDLVSVIFTLDEVAQRYRPVTIVERGNPVQHEKVLQGFRSQIYLYATHATRFAEGISMWRKMITQQLLTALKKLIVLQQPVADGEIDSDAVEQAYLELEKINDQTKRLNNIESHFDVYQAAIDLYSDNPSEPSEYELVQLNKQFEAILNERDTLQARINRLKDKLAAVFTAYQLAHQQYKRAPFFIQFASDLESYRDEIRAINHLLDERFQQYLVAKRRLYIGRSLPEFKKFFKSDCAEITRLQAKEGKVRSILNKQAQNVQELNLFIQAEGSWLIEMQSNIANLAELNTFRALLDRITGSLLTSQQQLNHYVEHCCILFSHPYSFVRISADIAIYSDNLKNLRQALLVDQQHLLTTLRDLGNLTVDEIIALHGEQQIPAQPKAQEIVALRKQIQSKLNTIAEQLQQISGLEHQLVHHQIWLKVICFATDSNLKHLVSKLKKIQDELRESNTGALSTIAIAHQMQAISVIPATCDPSFQGKQTVEETNKLLAKQITDAKQYEARLKLLCFYLQEILNKLGVDLTIEQMTSPPLNLNRKKAELIHTTCQQTVAQMTVCDQLIRRVGDVIKHATQKQNEINATQNKPKTYFFTKPKPETYLTPRLRPLIHPSNIHSKKTQIIMSDTGLPVFVDETRLEFFPQSHLAHGDRRTHLSETTLDYTDSNEFDTLRQMVDQAVCNKWQSLKILDGFTEEKPRRVVYLMVICARAELQNLIIDWEFLKQKDFRHNNKQYRRIFLQEQALLEQERRVNTVQAVPMSTPIEPSLPPLDAMAAG